VRRTFTGAAFLAAAIAASGCGAGSSSPASHAGLARPPYVGIACGIGNSKSSAESCDRVGVAVWLDRDAERVRASIGRHEVQLHRVRPSHWSGTRPSYWMGYLHPAGLDGGALALPRPGSDLWEGKPAVTAPIVIAVAGRDGSRITIHRRITLAPGFA
jgi:hypothetical protein